MVEPSFTVHGGHVAAALHGEATAYRWESGERGLPKKWELVWLGGTKRLVNVVRESHRSSPTKHCSERFKRVACNT